MGTSWSEENTTGDEVEQPSLRPPQSDDTAIHEIQITNPVKLPHNYENILKDADPLLLHRSSREKLYDQLRAGIYLKQNRQKYWIDKDGRNCFKLFAKDLLITWAEDSSYWRWPFVNESGDVSIPAAELLNVCWLEIHGRFETVKCSPGTMYEVVFVVMLKDPAYGWEVPVNLRLILPDGTKQEHKEKLVEKQMGRWIEIPAGEFIWTSMDQKCTGEMEFSLYEYNGGKWKRGLVIKEVVIRPKSG